MGDFSAKQRRKLGQTIRDHKEKKFPGRGGGNRLAQELGIRPQLLSQWIGGVKEPTMLQLYALAKAFGISIQELCAMPKIKKSKGKVTGLDMVSEITDLYKLAHINKISAQRERRFLTTIKSMISNELDDVI